MATVFVTGAAGFIGFHLCQRLLARGDAVIGLDNLNDYYDVRLKAARLAQLTPHSDFSFYRRDLADREGVTAIFTDHRPDSVVNLAAQAGVRYARENPYVYIQSNVVGFLNVLEGCRHAGVRHLVFASSSSVYGANTRIPFSVHDNVDHPLSLYAASKKSNELMAHTYSHLYGLAATGLRFFTVYGPWGRPDMALFKFTQAILEGKPIDVYNCGNMQRDFTYIEDIIEGIVRVLDRPATPDPAWTGAAPDPATSSAPFRIYNIGASRPVELLTFITLLEERLGKPAIKNLLPMQPDDVPATYADVDALMRDTGFAPTTPVEVGVTKFVDWYRSYYQV